jgi:hypothetical protein
MKKEACEVLEQIQVKWSLDLDLQQMGDPMTSHHLEVDPVRLHGLDGHSSAGLPLAYRVVTSLSTALFTQGASSLSSSQRSSLS